MQSVSHWWHKSVSKSKLVYTSLIFADNKLTSVCRLMAPLPGQPEKASTRKKNQPGFKWGKRLWNFEKQWHQLDHRQSCKQSAPFSRQINTPTPYHSIFTGRMLFLTHNQQQQTLKALQNSAVVHFPCINDFLKCTSKLKWNSLFCNKFHSIFRSIFEKLCQQVFHLCQHTRLF